MNSNLIRSLNTLMHVPPDAIIHVAWLWLPLDVLSDSYPVCMKGPFVTHVDKYGGILTCTFISDLVTKQNCM